MVSMDSKTKKAMPSLLFNELIKLQMANIIRFKSGFSLVFLGIQNAEYIGEENMLNLQQDFVEFMRKQIRSSDVLFDLNHENELVVLLTNSEEIEAQFFIERIYKNFKEFTNGAKEWSNEGSPTLASSILEVRNAEHEVEDVVIAGREALSRAFHNGPWSIQYERSFNEIQQETIKVSIIESDLILRQILQRTVEHMQLDHFELITKTFENGNEYLESDWHKSGHTHIVLLDEVLAMKNGIEVLIELRNMPNSRKFMVLMLSEKNSDYDMIYAFQQGVDEYITKPFNVKYVSERIKRLLKRYR